MINPPLTTEEAQAYWAGVWLLDLSALPGTCGIMIEPLSRGRWWQVRQAFTDGRMVVYPARPSIPTALNAARQEAKNG